MSLTASAPPAVECELVQSLHLENPVFVRKCLDRPNIFYSVGKKSGLSASLQTFVVQNKPLQLWQIDLAGLAEQLKTESPESIPKAIIFATTKTLTMQLYSFLSRCARFKHYVGVYHASLTKETKDFVYRNFVARSSEMRCLCATIAFRLVSSSFSVQSLLASFSHLPRE